MKKRVLTIISVTFMLMVTFTSVTIAEKLLELTVNNDGNKFYLDTDSIVKKGSEVNLIGVLIVGQETRDKYKKMTGKTVAVNKMKMVIDCKNKKIRHSGYMNYDENNNLVEEYDAPDSESKWMDIVPGRPHYKIYENVCR